MDEFYLQYIRTFFPRFNKVMSYINMYAAAIVGTWVERPNVCRTESASMCRSLYGTKPVKNENNQNAKVNHLILYRTVTRRLEIICYTTKNHRDNQFFILSKARSDFHLSVFESIFMIFRKPNFC